MTPFLCSEIADRIELATPWLQAFLDIDAAHDLVGPFLSRAALGNELGWEELAEKFLRTDTYRFAVIEVVLRLTEPPQNLFDKILNILPEYSGAIEVMCLRNEIPQETTRHLLRHEDKGVACAAAHGEWSADPQGEICPSLYEDWEHAILSCAVEGHWLSEVFQSNPSLAQKWLGRILRASDQRQYVHGTLRAAETAVGTVGNGARVQLFDQIRVEKHHPELVALIISGDLALYRALLKRKRLKYLHLIPLRSEPNSDWISKALIALESGFTTREIAETAADAMYFVNSTWRGSETRMWQDWATKFEPLCSHQDERIQEIGRYGREYAMSRMNRAVASERHEAVYGNWQ